MVEGVLSAATVITPRAGRQVRAGRSDQRAFMLTRRSAVGSIGPLDKGYWMHMEDLDPLPAQGSRLDDVVRAVGPGVLQVKRGTKAGPRSPRLVWAFHYGMFHFYRAHYAPTRLWVVNWLVDGGIAARAIATLVRSVLDPSSGVRAC